MQFDGPDSAVHRGLSGNRDQIQINFLGLAVRRRHAVIKQQFCAADTETYGAEHRLQRTDSRAVRVNHNDIDIIRIRFPDLKTHGGLVWTDGKFNRFCLRVGQNSAGMAAGTSFVSGTDTDCGPAKPRGLVQVGFQKRGSAVGAVIISEAEIDCDGFLEKQRGADTVIQSHHQLGGPGKGIFSGGAELYGEQRRFRGDAPVQTVFPASPFAAAASGSDAENRRSVAAGVTGGNHPVSLRTVSSVQRLVDLLSGVQGSQGIAFRRTAGDCLIPERKKPGGTVGIAEGGMRIVHAGVDAGKERAVSEESPGAFLQRMDTGDASAGEIGEEQAFWFFYVGDLREVCDVVHQLFRKKQDGVLKEKIGDADAAFFQKRNISLIAHDHLPGAGGKIVSGAQGGGSSPFCIGGVQGKIQKIFAFLIVHV